MLLSLYLAVLDDQSDEEQFIDAAVDEQAALDALETFAQNWEISQDRKVVAGKLDEPQHLLQISSASPPSDLYHEHDRGL